MTEDFSKDENADASHDTEPPTKRQIPPAPPTYKAKAHIKDNYEPIGFISSGTYGRVYQVAGINARAGQGVFAVKKFKPDKEGDGNITYTGLSQSAIREMSLCKELDHPNVIHLVEIILDEKCVFMVFEYCEHDLLQLIQYHSQIVQQQSQIPSTPTSSIGPKTRQIPASTIKSVLYQLLNGVAYLHANWVLHRDLKPANLMVTSAGEVRIGDLGLARIFQKPLHSLFNGDKVVVTIWYRAPELLLGSRHYTPAVDLWAVGCIFAELLGLRPIFKGEEAKMDGKKNVPFQKNQMQKIAEILGMPSVERWEGVTWMPEYSQLQGLPYAVREQGNKRQGGANNAGDSGSNVPPGLERWYSTTLHNAGYVAPHNHPGQQGLELMAALLEYDPAKRLTARQALDHPYFHANGEKPSADCFDGGGPGERIVYPPRRVSKEAGDLRISNR